MNTNNTPQNNYKQLIQFDKKHILHPYAKSDTKTHCVKSANGVYLYLEDGTKLIDGMSSWWSAIHGYNVDELNNAAKSQLEKMSHVMFGGLTHKSAIDLSKNLLQITHNQLEHIFYSDSGSVSVEVAIKMAYQYWSAKGIKTKTKILSFYKGYHGDTFGAMSVSDPINGMHSIFNHIIHENIFATEPMCSFDSAWSDEYILDFKTKLKQHSSEIAAVIIEPIVQGAGGMRIYSPYFLKKVKELCEKFDVLLILDEIATGFGRTGKLFAYEHADIAPDILCIGKGLTGGYMSLGATLATNRVIQSIQSNGNVFMHGPTFMANPLACSVANASVELLLNSPWQERVSSIENILKTNLLKCSSLDIVKDVRVLGAIGVVELNTQINLEFMSEVFINQGVWIRPFLNLVYIMPPYIISQNELEKLCESIYICIKEYQKSLAK